MAEKNLGKTSVGMEANVAALLSYLLGFVTGIIFYVIEKDNKFVRFHAMQSMIVFGGLFVINAVLSFILGIRSVGLAQLIGLAGFALWIILMIKAYQGEMFKLPVVGDIAEKNAK